MCSGVPATKAACNTNLTQNFYAMQEIFFHTKERVVECIELQLQEHLGI